MTTTEDDLLAIPAFLRRTLGEAVRPRKPTPRSKRRGWIMPKRVKAKTRKHPGIPAALRHLGWRPCEIRRMSRAEAEQIAALRIRPSAAAP